jgi:hypothetical protein
MKIPAIYKITHYLCGVLSNKFKYILIIFLLYQFIQWKLNVRSFLMDFECYTQGGKKRYKKKIQHNIH